jgi:hypothetical protein
MKEIDIETLINLLTSYKQKYGNLPIYITQDWGADCPLNENCIAYVATNSSGPERIAIGY